MTSKALSEGSSKVHFLETVEATVEAKQNAVYASWYDNKGRCVNERTFGEVWEEAGKISCYLRDKWNVKQGERVILCYDFGLHFFEVFLGCLRAGVTAVLGEKMKHAYYFGICLLFPRNDN